MYTRYHVRWMWAELGNIDVVLLGFKISEILLLKSSHIKEISFSFISDRKSTHSVPKYSFCLYFGNQTLKLLTKYSH